LRVKPSVIAHRYLTSIEAAGHGIVLLHDRVGHVGSEYALDIARTLVPQLKARGFVFAAPVLQFSPLTARSREAPGDSAISSGRAHVASPIRMGDINGDGASDVCARSSLGFECATSGVAGAQEPSPRAAFRSVTLRQTSLRDAAGWSAPAHRTSAELADVDGDGRADLCARASEGIVCGLANPSGRSKKCNGGA